jgi:hypothetical protein
MALPISNIPSLGLARLVDGLSLDLSQVVAPIAQISFTVDRDAAYNNSVGFYRALDADGATLPMKVIPSAVNSRHNQRNLAQVQDTEKRSRIIFLC